MTGTGELATFHHRTDSCRPLRLGNCYHPKPCNRERKYQEPDLTLRFVNGLYFYFILTNECVVMLRWKVAAWLHLNSPRLAPQLLASSSKYTHHHSFLFYPFIWLLLIDKDGVVLGADTRATEGPIVADKNCEKIHYIAPNMYCCGAGTAADTEMTTMLISSQVMLHRLSSGRECRLVTALTMLKQMLFKFFWTHDHILSLQVSRSYWSSAGIGWCWSCWFPSLHHLPTRKHGQTSICDHGFGIFGGNGSFWIKVATEYGGEFIGLKHFVFPLQTMPSFASWVC